MVKSDQKFSGFWRALVIILTFGVAYLSGVTAVVGVTRIVSPEIALSFESGDALALAAQADSKWAEAAANGTLRDVSSDALRSLRAHGINPRATRLLGYSVEALGNRKRAERLNRLAAQLTRRESAAQLWLMENSVEQNAVGVVLAHYDVLLRTNTAMRQQLFPKLAYALSDAEVRDAFIPYIRKAPDWLPGLIGYAQNTPNPDALSYAIRQAGGLPETAVYQSYSTALLNQLFTKHKYAEARAFYASLPGAKANMLTSPAFSETAFEPKFAPVAWSLESSSSVGATLAKDDSVPAFNAYALAGANGVAAHKFLFIPPGLYRFDAAQTIITAGANSRGAWILRCMSATDQVVIYQYDIIRNGRGEAPSMQIEVPADCPVQRLELRLTGGDDSAGLELRVASVTIRR
jgi:hypothetical protein